MDESEQPVSNEPPGERPHDPFARWLRLVTGGVEFQADLLSALTRNTVRTGQLLQRQNAALAESWVKALTGTGGRVQTTSEATTESPNEDWRRPRRSDPATVEERPGPRATETTAGTPAEQAPHQEQPGQAAHEGGTIPVAATENETPVQERTDSDQPAPATESERRDTSPSLQQVPTLGPREAERLQSAEIRTLRQLAAAKPRKLARETGLDPNRVRVWIFRARRVRRR